MKAVLVIDKPASCIECPFSKVEACGHIAETYCVLTAKLYWNGVNDRAKDCPLRPMPERQKYKPGTGGYTRGFTAGWNALINEVSGDE